MNAAVAVHVGLSMIQVDPVPMIASARNGSFGARRPGNPGPMLYAPQQSLLCLLLLSIACSGSAHRVQQSASGPESVFVSVANADCLKNETLATPLEAKGA